MNQTVLVTGGAGYIGSHICKELARKGYIPVIIDNLSYGHPESVKGQPLEVGDIRDDAFLDRLFHKYTPSAVIHCAAFAYVGESVMDPLKYYENNVSGSISLLKACTAHSVSEIIFSSTCATYGDVSKIPIPETHPQRPVNPYGHSKLMIEQVIRDTAAACGMRFAFLRYFNAAGADPDGSIGEDHDPETHLIPLILEAITNPDKPLKIFGDKYPTKDGTAIRDYIHVTDLAKAHVKALDTLRKGTKEIILNLGSGNPLTVLEIIQTAEKITGQAVPHSFGENRPGDPPKLLADNRKAMEVLGWKPELSDIETILSTAWAWHQKMLLARITVGT